MGILAKLKNNWPLLFTIIFLFVLIGILVFIAVTSWMEIQDRVKAAEGGPCGFPEAACNFAEAVGFPKSWLQSDAFIWYGIIPMFGMTLIIFGFLDQIKIFNRSSLNFAIAFFAAFSTIPLGGYVILVVVLFQLMGKFSIIVFGFMFFLGFIAYATRWGTSRVLEGYAYTKRELDKEKKVYDREKKELEKEIKKELKRMEHVSKHFSGAARTQAMQPHMERIEQLQDRIRILNGKIYGVKQRRKQAEQDAKRAKREVDFKAEGKATLTG